jgi:hypothetical protein
MLLKEVLVKELSRPYGEGLTKGAGWCQSWASNNGSIQGWSAGPEHLALYNAARISPRDVLEIGCFLGRSTVHLAAGVKISGRGYTVHVVDPFYDPFKVTYDDPNWRSWWMENFPKNGEVITGTKNTFMKNIKKCEVDDKVSVHSACSRDVHGIFPNDSLGVLFIDGNHTYDCVKEDFTLYFPKVIDGGLILFHDVIPSHPGIMKFIAELEADSHNGLEKMTHIVSLGIYRKAIRQ